MKSQSNLAHKKKHLEVSKSSSHIGRVKKRKIAQVRATLYITLISIAALVLSFYIMNLVKNNELTMDINLIKKQYKIEQSENVRLKAMFKATYLNAAEIEKYAKTKLGMRKNNNKHINYINRNKESRIKSHKSKGEVLKKEKNLFDKIKGFFKNIFKH